MIEKCLSEEAINTLLEYVGKDYFESLYLYLDAKKYGYTNANVNIWFQKDNGCIFSVILKYHTSMHIFSKTKVFDAFELAELIRVHNPSIICAETQIIDKLSDHLPDYKAEKGHVAQYLEDCKCAQNRNIRTADSSDYSVMAKMLMSDPDIGASYTLEELTAQIAERINDGYSRSYCMYINDELVAQASTGAEGYGVATIAYVMTDTQHRGKGYGKSIVTYLSNQLRDEGYDVYLIYYSDAAGRLYLKNGYKNVCNYGKLYREI